MAKVVVGSQEWFEMGDVRRRVLNAAVWIPLRVGQKILDAGEYGYPGFTEEYFGLESLAIRPEERPAAEGLGWSDMGISGRHLPYVEENGYVASDVERHDGVEGIRLVIEQPGNRNEPPYWHLNTDIVVALGLRREGDAWLAISEGYDPAARLRNDGEGAPALLEIKAAYLKDYLCARRLALYVNSYRSRTEIVENASHVRWSEEIIEKTERDEWRAFVREVHEGGMPFGEGVAVFHASRTDIDSSDDVPVMGPPTDENIESKSWTREFSGRKLYFIRSELWRSEWVEPGRNSPRVRGDKSLSPITFIIDAEGTREAAADLVHKGRWLWSRPDVINALLSVRGSSLVWHTRDTGGVSCSPDYGIHFGVNDLGLVTVYAKDIALLPEWQQRIWAGYNVAPEGGVSAELLASQVEAKPASTQAPESFLERALDAIANASTLSLGESIIRDHERRVDLLRSAHRFRATNEPGLFSLAKDITRVVTDSIDATVLQKVVAPPKGEKWGSLKSLENVVAVSAGKDKAHRLLGPLHGAYELRHADAHLPKRELDEALELLRIDKSLPYPLQGLQLLGICVTVLFKIADAIERMPKPRRKES